MPQHARLQIARAAEGVDQAAVRILGDRVDREVAARKVLIQRHVGRGVEDEALVAAAGLPLGARQRVLLSSAGVQEHRKVRADRPEAGGNHRLRRRADDDVIAVADRHAQQPVADRAADEEDGSRGGQGHPARLTAPSRDAHAAAAPRSPNRQHCPQPCRWHSRGIQKPQPDPFPFAAEPGFRVESPSALCVSRRTLGGRADAAPATRYRRV